MVRGGLDEGVRGVQEIAVGVGRCCLVRTFERPVGSGLRSLHGVHRVRRETRGLRTRRGS